MAGPRYVAVQGEDCWMVLDNESKIKDKRFRGITAEKRAKYQANKLNKETASE